MDRSRQPRSTRRSTIKRSRRYTVRCMPGSSPTGPCRARPDRPGWPTDGERLQAGGTTTRSPGTSSKMRSADTRSRSSRMAVAAIHRSASWTFWPRPWPAASHRARSRAQTAINSSSGCTITRRARSRSSPRRRRSPHPALSAPYRSSVTVAKDTTTRRPAMSARYVAEGSDSREALRIEDTTIVSTTTAADPGSVTAQRVPARTRSTRPRSGPRSPSPSPREAVGHAEAPPRAVGPSSQRAPHDAGQPSPRRVYANPWIGGMGVAFQNRTFRVPNPSRDPCRGGLSTGPTRDEGTRAEGRGPRAGVGERVAENLV